MREKSGFPTNFSSKMPYLTPATPKIAQQTVCPSKNAKEKHTIFSKRQNRVPFQKTEKHQEYDMQLQKKALTPRRRRMTASAARERSPNAKDGPKLVRNRTCTNYIHAHPHIKVLRSFFKSDRSPVSPASPVPYSRSRQYCVSRADTP